MARQLARLFAALLLLLNLALLPLACAPPLMLLQTNGPLFVVFVTSFSVTNASRETVWVTPVGKITEIERKCTLPVQYFSLQELLENRCGGFVIPPGGTKSISYDWDDVQFSDLVIEDKHGICRTLAVYSKPVKQSYYSVDGTFVIKDLDRLPMASAEERDIHFGARTTRSILPLFALCLLPAITLPKTLRFSKRLWTGEKSAG